MFEVVTWVSTVQGCDDGHKIAQYFRLQQQQLLLLLLRKRGDVLPG